MNTRYASVVTPQHMNLEYQLNPLTDKCKTLEKCLIEEKRMHTNFFLNKVFKKEIQKNTNLKMKSFKLLFNFKPLKLIKIS